MLIVQTDRIIELYHDLVVAMIYLFTNETMQTMKIAKIAHLLPPSPISHLYSFANFFALLAL